jgi:hypothetical protein
MYILFSGIEKFVVLTVIKSTLNIMILYGCSSMNFQAFE